MYEDGLFSFFLDISASQPRPSLRRVLHAVVRLGQNGRRSGQNQEITTHHNNNEGQRKVAALRNAGVYVATSLITAELPHGLYTHSDLVSIPRVMKIIFNSMGDCCYNSFPA